MKLIYLTRFEDHCIVLVNPLTISYVTPAEPPRENCAEVGLTNGKALIVTQSVGDVQWVLQEYE